MSDPSQSRKYSRTAIGKKIPISVGSRSEISSLGFGGLYISTPDPLSVGSLFDLDLPLPDEEPPIRVKAKVIYAEQGEGMGIEFIDLKEEDAARIGVFLLLNR